MTLVLGACNTGTGETTTTSETATTSPDSTVATVPSTTTTAEAATTTSGVGTTRPNQDPSTTTVTNPNPPTTSGDPVPPDNQAPLVEITAPDDLSSHQAELNDTATYFGALVTLSVEVSEPDGDNLTLEWFSSDQGYLGASPSFAPFLIVPEGESAQPEITARVTDQWGAVSEDSITITLLVPSDN